MAAILLPSEVVFNELYSIHILRFVGGACDGGRLATPQPAQDPLAGWKWLGAYNRLVADSIKRTTGTRDALGRVITTTSADHENYAKECPFGSAVVDDYQSFIKKKKFDWVINFEFFENGTGQHAVKIAAGRNGTYSTHILMYDSSGHRTRVISYVTGRYRC